MINMTASLPIELSRQNSDVPATFSDFVDVQLTRSLKRSAFAKYFTKN